MVAVQTRFSRRAFLTAAGGGLVSATLVWSCGRFRTDSPRRAGAESAFDRYVDHEGWMLTPADKEGVRANQVATSGAR